MKYIDWFESHASKHKKIVEKLLSDGYTKEQIVDYFDFDNMKKNEEDFCPLYKENKKCHDMKSLNCYMCACPNFRFNDDGVAKYNEQVILSECSINNGKKFAGGGFIHQDCSSCIVPHHQGYILKNFSYDWRKIMSECETK